jgi:hypothetical protein
LKNWLIYEQECLHIETVKNYCFDNRLVIAANDVKALAMWWYSVSRQPGTAAD